MKDLHSELSYKRLERGRHRWPQAQAGESKVVLSQEELALLVCGIELAGSRRRAWFRKVVGESEGKLTGNPSRQATLLQEGIA